MLWDDWALHYEFVIKNIILFPSSLIQAESVISWCRIFLWIHIVAWSLLLTAVSIIKLSFADRITTIIIIIILIIIMIIVWRGDHCSLSVFWSSSLQVSPCLRPPAGERKVGREAVAVVGAGVGEEVEGYQDNQKSSCQVKVKCLCKNKNLPSPAYSMRQHRSVGRAQF